MRTLAPIALLYSVLLHLFHLALVNIVQFHYLCIVYKSFALLCPAASSGKEDLQCA